MLHFLTYVSPDPDEARRGLLFNIFVGGLLVLPLGMMVINVYELIAAPYPDAWRFFIIKSVIIVILIGLLFLHRLYPKVVRHAFLVFCAVATVNFFEIRVLDRQLVVLTVPVLMAAFIISPISSYVYGLVVNVAYGVVFLISYLSGEWGDETLTQVLNYPSMLSIFVIAFIAWLVSRSLDQALVEARQRAEELRVLNEELDHRVQDRTRELARALEREHTTAVRNQTILESIGDGVLVTDNYGNVILANPAVNRLAEQELEAKLLKEALSTARSEVLAEIEDYMAGETKDEQPNIRFEWNQRTIAANIAPIRLDLPDHTHISGGHVMVLRDVTREAELDRMKTIFLGSVSHELRTPMTAIKGYVDLLSDIESESLSETGRKYLGIVGVNIRQLLSLANDLIDMSRIEVGELALYAEWAELEPIVTGAVDTVRPEFEKRDLRLDVEVEPDLPLLYFDRHRITQVLLNLLTNAYKYTVEGGATVKVTHFNNTVQVVVRDTGVGMTEEEQTHLFERFFRSNSEVVQRAGGSGLGLTIAKSMIELHGGTISFTSTYNVGTAFTVSLPVAEVPEFA